MELRPSSKHCDRTLSMARAYSSQSRNRSKTEEYSKTDFIINMEDVKRPQTTDGGSSFRDSISRFEQYASLRSGLSRQELNNSSLLGPGAYDSSPITKPNAKRSAGGKANGGMTATRIYQSHTIFPVPQAPPVGSYNLPQIMNEASYGSMGIQVTSSFKSSGRSKPLLSDGVRFQTLSDAGSNVGPGSYDAASSYIGRISVSPTANDRNFRANRSNDKKDANFRETLKMLSTRHMRSGTGGCDHLRTLTLDDGRPSTPTQRSHSPLGTRRKKDSPSSGAESSLLSSMGRSQQLHVVNCRQIEIMEVQRLPSYG